MNRERCSILHDAHSDLLSIRLDNRKQAGINRRFPEGMEWDMGEDDAIVGIDILDALNSPLRRGSSL